MSSRPRASRKTKKTKKGKPQSEAMQVERLWKTIHQTKRNLKRWLNGSESSLSTNGSGVVPLTTLANSASITSCPDWASLATLYTAYRCHAIRVELIPYYPVPVYNGTVIVTVPSLICVFPWMSNNVPTTLGQALDVVGCRTKSGYERLLISNTYKGDPDAHLWTATTGAIGGGEQFGISCIGTSTACTASNFVWKILVNYLVEFRMVG